MARQRSEPYSAFAASVALHVGVLAAAILLSRMFNAPLRIGDVTTVTLVTSADVANLRAAQPAPTPTAASTPTPVPDAEDKPVPPAPQAAPTPTPAPTRPSAATTPNPFDKVSRDLAGGGSPSPAHKGSRQAATQPTTGSGAGNGRVAAPADVAGLTTALEKVWVHSCDDVNDPAGNVDVSFHVGPDGYLLGDPVAKPPNTIAARRAINAIYKLNPFKDFRGLNGRYIPNVHFNAKEACAQR